MCVCAFVCVCVFVIVPAADDELGERIQEIEGLALDKLIGVMDVSY